LLKFPHLLKSTDALKSTVDLANGKQLYELGECIEILIYPNCDVYVITGYEVKKTWYEVDEIQAKHVEYSFEQEIKRKL
jgi:hypothetical protein